MHKIAGKLAKRLRKESARSVVSMDAYKQARPAAEEAVASIRQPDALVREGYHPVHACYGHAQNLLSVILEALLLFPELDRFSELVGTAEEEYMPGGPPMSSVTTSYFTCWSAFDVAIGLQKETLTSIVLDLKHFLKLPASVVTLMEHFHHSRMGIYEHLGIDNGHVRLLDWVTQKTFRVFNPTGYLGATHELWFVRLLPGLSSDPQERICFTTPYVLTSKSDSWRDFFKRGTWRTQKKTLSHEHFLKYGPSRCCWLEFIHQAYLGINEEGTAIFLQGLPDLGTTRPHYSTVYISRLPEAVG